MPARIEPHAEPIPGYRLIERIGGGGFGEVWKAEAPGGLYKAIKFVYGDLCSSEEGESFRAEQELKALSRVKTVHHPYIISLDRFDIIGGQLLIVMELADRTLWDRFRECRSQGLPGIPRQELLSYLAEAAEALDLMNNQFQLQHLDIKPQNLFLVFNHVKVADFGLVKDLGTRAAATITGGVTPVYAAPETFDGWLSRHSDQYSLAIVYQELLTGQRPFAGSTMRQLILQHLQGKPDLSSLPAADRPIIERALAKDPDQRFPTCMEFVQQLLPLGKPAHGSGTVPVVNVADVPPPVSMATPNFRTKVSRTQQSIPRETEDVDAQILERPHLSAPRPDQQPNPAKVDTPRDGEDDLTSTQPRVKDRPAARPAPLSPSNGIIQPALVIGLGQFGLRTLQQLRAALNADYERPENLPCIRLLGLDTDQEALQAVVNEDERGSLLPAETILTRLHRPSHYLKGKLETDTWLNGRLIYRIPRELNSAGLRPLGRLAFVDNYRQISRRLEAELQACCEAARAENSPLSLRSRTPRVYIAVCLAGNTGGGMFLDVAHVVRQYLCQLGHNQAEIVGLFFLPSCGEKVPASLLSNTYAALTELSHYTRNYFKARYEGAPTLVANELTPLFDRCVVLNVPKLGRIPDLAEAGRSATREASELLYRDLVTVLGQAADGARNALLSSAPDEGLLLQTFGMYRLNWPRRPLLETCGRRLSRRLVEHWMNKDARAIADAVKEWAAQRWDDIAMRPENLIARHQEQCEKILKQTPDRLIADLFQPLAEQLRSPRSAAEGLNVGPMLQALSQLEKLLGLPEECRPSQQTYEPSQIELALAEASGRIADESERKLAELAVRLIEDPQNRLAGAEEALRQFSGMVEKALQSQEPLAKELHERSVMLYQRVHQVMERPIPHGTPSQSMWKLSFGRRGNSSDSALASELVELLKLYAKARYHSLLLHHINQLYVSLRGHLSDQLREVGFCRQRLSELANLVQPPQEPSKPRKPARNVRVLLPEGCLALDEVVEKIDQGLALEDLLAFDEHMQELIRKKFHALVQVCMGSSSTVRALAPLLIREAEKFLEPNFQETSIAELFLAQKAASEDTNQAAVQELEAFYRDAAPAIASPSGQIEEFAVAVIPKDACGQELQALLQQHLPHVHVIGAERRDELIFFRERSCLTLADLEQLGTRAQEAYRQRLAQDPIAVHSREDVVEWQPLDAVSR